MTLIKDIFRAERPTLRPKSLGRERAYAQTWTKANPVEIDLRLNINPAKKYLHELIHQVRPTWSEPEVRAHEGKLWKRLTQKQITALFKMMFSD
jgi:hypothetical protein